MKKALGMITRSLDSEAELMGFIENAEKFGHKLDCVIVAYTYQHDKQIEQNINKRIPFYTIDIKNPHYCREQMQIKGISGNTQKVLLECPVDTTSGLVPYGFNRMMVVMEAILRGMDTLFFIDSDVYPKVLKRKQDEIVQDEIDFFGAHLKHLYSGSEVTTGEYSGYNILPPAIFNGMGDLLVGVQKSEMLDYWKTGELHRCLVTQPDKIEPKPCRKVLGGNMAIKLSAFAKLPPFFSSYYMRDGEIYLCRGEDTMLGMGIAQKGIKCTDIGVNPLHDTYKDYPVEPDLRGNISVQNRFFFACTGWVGRNPLLNHILGNDLKSTREYQRECLERGLNSLAKYTGNPRFIEVMKNFEISWDSTDRYISEFNCVTEAWEDFVKGTMIL